MYSAEQHSAQPVRSAVLGTMSKDASLSDQPHAVSTEIHTTSPLMALHMTFKEAARTY